MATATRRWMPIVAGLAVSLASLAIGAVVVSVAWFRENTTLERGVDASRMEDAFAAAARRFPDPRPGLEVGEGRRPRPAQRAARTNPGQVTTLHVLAWDPAERALADVALPMWLVRLKSEPFALGAYVTGLDDHRVQFTAAEIERLGPGVLVDYTSPSGERVLLFAH